MRLAVHCLVALLLVTEGSAVAFMAVNTVNRFTNPKAVVYLTPNPFANIFTMPERMIIAVKRTSFVRNVAERAPEQFLEQSKAKSGKTLPTPKSKKSLKSQPEPQSKMLAAMQSDSKPLDPEALPEKPKKPKAKAGSGNQSTSPKAKTSVAKKPAQSEKKAVASQNTAKPSPVAATAPKPSGSKLAQSEKPEGLFTLVP